MSFDYGLDDEPHIRYAIQRIKGDFGHDVSVDAAARRLHRVGRNDNLDTTRRLLWLNTTVAEEVRLTDNLIDSISSDDDTDAQVMQVEGQRLVDGNLISVIQSVQLNGETRVALPIPLARGTSMFVNDFPRLEGQVWLYENTSLTNGVPSDKTKAHLTATGAKNQSEKAAAVAPFDHYLILTSFYGSVLTKQSAAVEIDLQIARTDKAYRTIMDISMHSNGGLALYPFSPFEVVRPNSDVRTMGVSGSNNAEAVAGLSGYFAKIIG